MGKFIKGHAPHITKHTNETRELMSRNRMGLDQKKHDTTTSSRHKGVCRHHGKWMAYIRHEGKTINLGRWVDEDEAAEVYNEAALRLKGPDAVLNTVD